MNAACKQLLVSGVIQLIIGSFCLIFGIVERVAFYVTSTSAPGLAIWMGLWIGITGFIGIIFKSKAAVYFGFSIISVVFAAAMIISYSLSIFSSHYSYYYLDYYYHRQSGHYVISMLIFILSFLEFAIGIWACVCCCLAFSDRQSSQSNQATAATHQDLQMRETIENRGRPFHTVTYI